jgi:hypothetical protein|tara:strand:- start:406 stop:705 length:300 start_codon:yes stop_codon:yes gene_type:complete
MQESRLTVALDERFTDIEEVKDVADHGCEGGVSGFIYYSETSKFFDEYQEEIEEELEETLGDEYLRMIAEAPTVHNTRDLKNFMVWSVVSCYCTDKAYS